VGHGGAKILKRILNVGAAANKLAFRGGEGRRERSAGREWLGRGGEEEDVGVGVCAAWEVLTERESALFSQLVVKSSSSRYASGDVMMNAGIVTQVVGLLISGAIAAKNAAMVKLLTPAPVLETGSGGHTTTHRTPSRW
jgi:hypothetical protein